MTLVEILDHIAKTDHQDRGHNTELGWHCHVCGYGGICRWIKDGDHQACSDIDESQK